MRLPVIKCTFPTLTHSAIQYSVFVHFPTKMIQFIEFTMLIGLPLVRRLVAQALDTVNRRWLRQTVIITRIITKRYPEEEEEQRRPKMETHRGIATPQSKSQTITVITSGANKMITNSDNNQKITKKHDLIQLSIYTVSHYIDEESFLPILTHYAQFTPEKHGPEKHNFVYISSIAIRQQGRNF